MKTIDTMKARLKDLALAATFGSVTLSTLWPTAQADLVGHWISGANNLNETSGYRPAGSHDGIAVGWNGNPLTFSSDLPPGFAPGYSLQTFDGKALSIANSSTADGAYQDTYDDLIRSKFTIAFWAKGFPNGGWNPWVSKRGDDGIGWQIPA